MVAVTVIVGGAETREGLAEVDFDAFVAAHWQRLTRTAYLLTGDHHEAEDLVQVTLAKVYPHWARIRRLDAPNAYLHRAMVNNGFSRQRRRRARQLLMPWVPERAQPSAMAQVEQRSALLRALDELPPRQRAVVVLRYWEDLSERQVADVLGCTTGNVKSQASRGLAKLRNHQALAGYAASGSMEEQ
ncbi:RNA polymerase sigma-70 factor (sigma-E family) [Streptacidiphilus sp. MAP5-3]